MRISVQEGNLREIREQLARENETFKKLKERHQHFEARLEALQDKSCLSDDERIEEKRLKVEKLHVKDRMEAIVRQHRSVVGSEPIGS
jgi:uncharacterized protein YdcH (DUF465 family)